MGLLPEELNYYIINIHVRELARQFMHNEISAKTVSSQIAAIMATSKRFRAMARKSIADHMKEIPGFLIRLVSRRLTKCALETYLAAISLYQYLLNRLDSITQGKLPKELKKEAIKAIDLLDMTYDENGPMSIEIDLGAHNFNTFFINYLCVETIKISLEGYTPQICYPLQCIKYLYISFKNDDFIFAIPTFCPGPFSHIYIKGQNIHFSNINDRMVDRLYKIKAASINMGYKTGNMVIHRGGCRRHK